MDSSSQQEATVSPDNATFWNSAMKRQSYFMYLIWLINNRWFAWDGLPALARLPFIQKSYFLLLLIPAVDHFFSPIIDAPEPIKFIFDFHWQRQSTLGGEGGIDASIAAAGKPIAFSFSLPFSWRLIYALVLFMGIGSILYELCCPRLIGRDPSGRIVTPQIILQNFREIPLRLFTASRSNHFVYDFLKRYTTNWQDLLIVTPEDTAKAAKQGHTLVPVPNLESNSDKVLTPLDKEKAVPMKPENPMPRLNRHSVYFAANKMVLSPDKLNDALENLRWYMNETLAPIRWIIGICFSSGVGIFGWLVFSGFLQMMK